MIYSDGRHSLRFSLCNGRSIARSSVLSSTVWLTRFFFALLGLTYGKVSHGRLSYGSVVYSIRKYHLQCVCHEAAWAAHVALSSAEAHLERYFSTWHLSQARNTYQATRLSSSAATHPHSFHRLSDCNHHAHRTTLIICSPWLRNHHHHRPPFSHKKFSVFLIF